MTRIVVGLLALFAVPTARGAVPLTLNSDFSQVRAGQFLEVYEDTTTALTLEQVLASPERYTFQPSQGKLNFGMISSAVWSRLILVNALPEAREAYLEIKYPSIDYIDFYVFKAGKLITTVKTGDKLPFSSRPYRYRNVLLPVSIGPSEEVVIVMRTTSSGSVNLDSTLWAPQSFRAYHNEEQAILGLYNGVMIALLLYNLVLAITTREILYLYYCTFAAVATLFFSIWNGVALQLIWPNSPTWHNIALPIFLMEVVVWGAVFSAEYLNLKERMPRMNKFLRITAACVFVFSLASVGSYRISLLVALSSVACVCSFVFALGVVSLKQRYRPAFFYVLAWTTLLCTAVLSAFAAVGVFELPALTTYSTQIGSALEALLLSFGMGDKFNILKREKAAAQHRLQRNLQVLLATTQEMAVAHSADNAGLTATHAIIDQISWIPEPTVELIVANKAAGASLITFVRNGIWVNPPAVTAVAADDPLNELLQQTRTAQTELPRAILTPIGTGEHGRSLLRISASIDFRLTEPERNFIGATASSLAIALENIFYTENLQQLVDERTSALAGALQKVKFLLENMPLGVLTFDSKLKIDNEYSSFTHSIFGTSHAETAGQNVVDFFFGSSDQSENNRNQMLESLQIVIGEDIINWEANSHLLVPQTEIKDRKGTAKVIALDWHPLMNSDEQIEKVMLSVRDVTTQVELQKILSRKDAETARMMRALGEMIKLKRSSLKQYLVESGARLKVVRGEWEGARDASRMFRELHTLKGGARVLGLSEITESTHLAEDMLKAIIDGNSLVVQEFSERIVALVNVYEFYCNIFGSVLRGFEAGMRDDEGASGSASFSLNAYVGEALAVVRTNLEGAGFRLGRFVTSDAVLDWSRPGFTAVTSALMHALNNAVDHGYVLPRGAGKQLPNEANFTLSSDRVGDRVVITLTDDGTGFDLAAIRQVASKRGFDPSEMNEQELLAVLFHDGVSTAEKVSASSGRGVGLAAVRDICESLGGQVSLARNSPRGAKLIMSMPLDAVVKSSHALAA